MSEYRQYPRLHLLSLPSEIRNLIYDIIAISDNPWQSEIRGSTHGLTDWCLPISQLRPPSLAQVSRQTSQEYLSIFFAKRCIRLWMKLGRPRTSNKELWRIGVAKHVDSWLTEVMHPEVFYDGPMRSYEDQIWSSNAPRFRNITIRFQDRIGVPLGANVDLRYNGAAKRFDITLEWDQGWPRYSESTIDRIERAFERLRTELDFLAIDMRSNPGLSWWNVKALAAAVGSV